MFTFLAAARSPVFNAMFEHEMEESKKVSVTENVTCKYLYLVKEENMIENLR